MFPPDPPPVLDLQLLAGAGARLLAHQVRGPGHRGLAPQPANQRRVLQSRVVLQKVPSEDDPKVPNHGEGPY